MRAAMPRVASPRTVAQVSSPVRRWMQEHEHFWNQESPDNVLGGYSGLQVSGGSLLTPQNPGMRWGNSNVVQE